MRDSERMLDEILQKISYEISITQPMIDKAVNSYEAVGKWLGDGLDYDVHISPQGSMSLGTTIKPISDEDDYDIDLVCLLKDGTTLTAENIKNIVGDRLKENETYRQKIESEGEGKRCWKMRYYEFHMDILPCVPKSIYLEPNYTEIRLTHKKAAHYYVDHFSNPYGYKQWFESRMTDILQKSRRDFAIKNKLDIDDVPTYRVKTPLQQAIQLLKRHRDICFEHDLDNAPISIIITTLSALAYNGESSVYEALCNILHHMSDYIEVRNGIYWVENPTMSEENFADKWEQYPQRARAFFSWIQKAQKELIEDPLSSLGIDSLKRKYAAALGEAPVNRAIKALGYDMQNAVKQNRLYSAGLTAGLTTTSNVDNKPVRGHTFYGK